MKAVAKEFESVGTPCAHNVAAVGCECPGEARVRIIDEAGQLIGIRVGINCALHAEVVHEG